MTKVLTISDLHIPFHNPKAFEFIKQIKREIKPDAVVILGDEVDAMLLSRFMPDPDGISAGDELELAVECIKELKGILPNAYITIGNHTDRVFKKAFANGIPKRLIKTYNEIYEVDKKWKWVENVTIDDVLYFHGDSFGGVGAHQAILQTLRKNVVIGHLHSLFGVTYANNGYQQNFVVSTGCLIDPTSYAFSYGSKSRLKPIIGTAAIVDGVPAMFLLE